MNSGERDRSELLINLTSDIVSAYLGNNNLGADDVTTLIGNVHTAIAGAVGYRKKQETPDPAVSIKRSVKRDRITCLECGKAFRTLKRHLGAEHALTPKQYRERWHLPQNYPMVAPSYAALRKKIATEGDLGGPRSEDPDRRKISA